MCIRFFVLSVWLLGCVIIIKIYHFLYMPPGPRQRRATKIANRSFVTPFDRLAQWNAQIMNLGSQGAIPSIVGNSLEFVKLNASNIPGVMDNPATEDLIMNEWDIIFSANGNIIMDNGMISGIQNLNSGSSGNLTLNAPTGNLTLDASTSIKIGNGTTLLDLSGTQINLDAGTTGLQLGSDANVTIDAANNIDINAGGNIELDAVGRLDLSGNQIYIDSDGAGGVNIAATTDITMDANNIDIEAVGVLDLSGTTTHIKGNTVDIDATILDIDTTTIDLKAIANIDIDADVTLTLGATDISIDGTTELKMDAPDIIIGTSGTSQIDISGSDVVINAPTIIIGKSGTSQIDISGSDVAINVPTIKLGTIANTIDVNTSGSSIDMDFKNVNNIKNVKLLTAQDISINTIDVTDLVVGSGLGGGSFTVNATTSPALEILNSADIVNLHVPLQLQTAQSSSLGLETSQVAVSNDIGNSLYSAKGLLPVFKGKYDPENDTSSNKVLISETALFLANASLGLSLNAAAGGSVSISPRPPAGTWFRFENSDMGGSGYLRCGLAQDMPEEIGGQGNLYQTYLIRNYWFTGCSWSSPLGGGPIVYLGGDAKLEMVVGGVGATNGGTTITTWTGPGGGSETPVNFLKYVLDLQSQDWIFINADITNDPSDPSGLRKFSGQYMSPVSSFIDFRITVPTGATNYCDIIKSYFAAPASNINHSRVRMTVHLASQPDL